MITSFTDMVKHTGKRRYDRVVWIIKSKNLSENGLAVKCRIGMGLKKREGGLQDEAGSERGKRRVINQREKKVGAGSLKRMKYTKPESFVFQKKTVPPVEHGMGDRKPDADLLDGIQTHQVFGNDPEDEEDTVSSVRNDQVRKDGMGMAACADDPCNPDFMINGIALNEIDQVSIVRGMNGTGMRGPTKRTDFRFRTESGHKRLKERFRRRFNTN